ncbi:recombinase family protein [Stenotrophomonas sp. MMGLT7]|uniref:recombinase family protein n=1 Tax=Stenotrophomonas sp. MMGLT7 TaxID=2901227 RepID=UPI0022B2256B|nr:recombinase family protein [Stenotrophomonas sp. MMGLT7]
MKVGYARVSTEDQNMDLQVAALERAGCRCILTDHGFSGGKFDRPGLHAAMERLRPGDSLTVWRLDRLGRSLRSLVELVDQLGKRDVHFISLTENIDTTSPGGMLLFHVMAALAEFERALISERTRAGMAAARARGIHVGRRCALTEEQRREALRAIDNHSPLKEVARRYNVHPRTLQRMLATPS